LAAAVLLAIGLSTVDASPAAAAGVGYVRLAHLSPDTPAVDVYLSSQSGAIAPKVFPGVGYGVVSSYLTVPTGTYAVAMRTAGAAASTPPVLSTQVTVVAGRAYTVAGVGRFADLGLRVLTDDLTLPTNGQAKVRIIQASVRAPVLDVAVAGGSTIAGGVPFATTTAYREVAPGHWTLTVQPAGGGTASNLDCVLAAGNVYSLLVLDASGGGLKAELRTDAQREGGMPQGGVETGAGGTGRLSTVPLLLMMGMGLVVAAALRWRGRLR
jgi:hypothetical protein